MSSRKKKTTTSRKSKPIAAETVVHKEDEEQQQQSQSEVVSSPPQQQHHHDNEEESMDVDSMQTSTEDDHNEQQHTNNTNEEADEQLYHNQTDDDADEGEDQHPIGGHSDNVDMEMVYENTLDGEEEADNGSQMTTTTKEKKSKKIIRNDDEDESGDHDMSQTSDDAYINAVYQHQKEHGQTGPAEPTHNPNKGTSLQQQIIPNYTRMKCCCSGGHLIVPDYFGLDFLSINEYPVEDESNTSSNKKNSNSPRASIKQDTIKRTVRSVATESNNVKPKDKLFLFGGGRKFETDVNKFNFTRGGKQKLSVFYATNYDEGSIIDPCMLLISNDVVSARELLDMTLRSKKRIMKEDCEPNVINTQEPQALLPLLDNPDLSYALTFTAYSHAEPVGDLKLFVCRNHSHLPPIPPCAIVLALDAEHAIQLLDEKLREKSLKSYNDHRYTLEPVDQTSEVAIELCDGQLDFSNDDM